MVGTLWYRSVKEAPQKILVCRTDRIGDFVSSLPVFEVLGNRLGLKVSVLCRPLTAPLLENNPFVSQVILYQPQRTKEVLEEIKAADFGAILALVNDPAALGLLPRLQEIPVRIGPLSKPKMLFYYNYPVLQKRSRSVQNEADYNLDLLRPLGYDGSNRPKPKLYFTELEEQGFLGRLQELLPRLDPTQGYVVVHPGMSGSALNWPESHYGELLGRMVERGLRVVLTGMGAQEALLVDRLVQGIPQRFQPQVFGLVDRLGLRELGLLCRFARGFVGPSTGPTHVAGAAGVPLVSFYPPILVQSATRWAPYQAQGQIFTPDLPCTAKRCCQLGACPVKGQATSDCMASLAVEPVFEAIWSSLRPKPAGP
ncbi:MAG: hypothetical protein A2600_14010 [Candidatus Lambdaproteobacteria bacterium RIFOXYD1_FULL_56_27]|uniref:Uncharacterized protein n=1 Tax=Candidatus Lambdaproteobacteria bacterium RIFOXYD2_FULL_56_26 TaxID=1817773 RepID=A0A1F6GNK5_9PROT|nr:MAG: hypothetical protein A2557_06235 [Candidatus Lambdaproteobacteria bacterium RIFOXYD2_FULL_56_26]OGG99904.1 MAG: hypothetical protein A2426_09970 [Candidatus Lambdaproteobacteria bacterium RIFOXYC1_FULL_56_13]OGH06303.1 MAG: hypothetical protein A2600_14010 [Candidatus Lambdaproteobacteria bacterium RIFOXYD1_FULL_56_27]